MLCHAKEKLVSVLFFTDMKRKFPVPTKCMEIQLCLEKNAGEEVREQGSATGQEENP